MRLLDTFVFDGELALLEHRLAETFDLLDAIVIVESAETFQGRSKPLHFQENQHRFDWAKPKLRHVALPRLPGASTWEREAFQRNAIQLGLYDAAAEDIILLLDADEIPSVSVLERLRKGGLCRPHRLMMTRHYGRFDNLAPRSACCMSPSDPFPHAVPHVRPGSWDSLSAEWWCTPGVAVRFKDITGDGACALPSQTPNALRRANKFAPRLPDAGRHLSSIAGAEELQTKLSHFSHAEHADEVSLALTHLQRSRKFNVHARGWWFAERPSGSLPSDLQRLRARVETENVAFRKQPLMRRLVRTWAWMRHAPHIPKSMAKLFDRHFEQLWPIVLVPLLFADAMRGVAARMKGHTPDGHSTTH